MGSDGHTIERTDPSSAKGGVRKFDPCLRHLDEEVDGFVAKSGVPGLLRAFNGRERRPIRSLPRLDATSGKVAFTASSSQPCGLLFRSSVVFVSLP